MQCFQRKPEIAGIGITCHTAKYLQSKRLPQIRENQQFPRSIQSQRSQSVWELKAFGARLNI